MVRLLLLAPICALAACTVSVNRGNDSDSGDDNALVSIEPGSGQVSVSGPGFSGNFQGPSLRPKAEDFSMNGVHLYPGSAITAFKVIAKGDDNGSVRVGFTSPAAAGTVRDWLKERLNKAGFTLSADGVGLTGKTDDGKPFALKLSDQGANKSSGTIDMGG